MSVYLIANVKLTDDAWISDYAEHVHGIVHKHGGKYLSRSANITAVEGDAPDVNAIALIEFPSMEAAQAMFADPEYQPYREARVKGTISNIHIIDDTDLVGSIPYFGKP